MDRQYFAVALFAGAAVLATWCYVRFEGRGPRSISGVLLHAVVAWGVLRAACAVLGFTAEPGTTALALFVIMLPALVYVFLASLWVLTMLRSAMPR
jgi:hypothetical protein